MKKFVILFLIYSLNLIASDQQDLHIGQPSLGYGGWRKGIVTCRFALGNKIVKDITYKKLKNCEVYIAAFKDESLIRCKRNSVSSEECIYIINGECKYLEKKYFEILQRFYNVIKEKISIAIIYKKKFKYVGTTIH